MDSITVKEVLTNWLKDHSWIEDTINPYIQKVAGEIPNSNGIIYASITENTHFCERSIIPFFDEMTISTGSGNVYEERGLIAEKVRKALDEFTKNAQDNRKKELDDLKSKGKNVLTTNVFGL